jgi:hypothetical protein
MNIAMLMLEGVLRFDRQRCKPSDWRFRSLHNRQRRYTTAYSARCHLRGGVCGWFGTGDGWLCLVENTRPTIAGD